MEQKSTASSNLRIVKPLPQILVQAPITLLDCPVIFTGNYGCEIERFLNFIAAYKSVKRISDEQALTEIPHLLRGHAYAWWTARPTELTSWPEAVLKLRRHFGQVKPAYLVYEEIFRRQEDDEDSWIGYLNEKVELFAQLPYPEPTDRTQLDMVYGLLSPKLREKIQRNELESIAHLVQWIKDMIVSRQQKISELVNVEEQNPERQHVPIKKVQHGENTVNVFSIAAKSDKDPAPTVVAEREPLLKTPSALEMNSPQVQKEDELVITCEVEECPSPYATAGSFVPQKNQDAQMPIDTELTSNGKDNNASKKIMRRILKRKRRLPKKCTKQLSKVLKPIAPRPPVVTQPAMLLASEQCHTRTTLPPTVTAIPGSTTTTNSTTVTTTTKQQIPSIVPAASEGHTTMTTKFLSAANVVTGMTKLVSTRMKDVPPSPTVPSCHQCATVYFGGICPTCYNNNYKQNGTHFLKRCYQQH